MSRMHNYFSPQASGPAEALAAFRDSNELSYYPIEGIDWDGARVEVARDVNDPVSYEQLMQFVDTHADMVARPRIDDGQLFQAFAIYEPGAADVRRVQVNIEVSEAELREGGGIFEAIDLVVEDLAPQLIQEGEYFSGSDIVGDDESNWYRGMKVQPRFETVRVNPQSPVQTRYFVMERGGRAFGSAPMEDEARWTDPSFAHFEHSPSWNGWDAGHLTLEAAQAELARILANVAADETGLVHVYNIVAQTRREDGTPLETVAQVMVGASATVELSFVRRPAQPQPHGWYIYTLVPESD